MRYPLVALLALSISLPAAGADWPQWRGPNRTGIAEGKPWPDRIAGDALTAIWKVEKLGPSYSGPIVSGDALFTTETVDGKSEVVRRFDRATGKPVWSKSWEGSMVVPFFAAKNGSWIRSTPACDGDSLYVGGIRDHLVCLDAKTGAVRWQLECPTELKAKPPDFGCVCSPLVDGKAVYMQAAGAFLKIDKKTGKVLWNVLADGGGMMGSAFSSPVLAKIAGRDQVVVQTRTTLFGIDPETGGTLWKRDIDSFRGMNILTPTVFGDGVFTSTYGGNTRLVGLRSEAGQIEAKDAWSYKYEGNMTTPVVVGGCAYFLGKDRKFACADLKTGKENWRTEKRFGEYWSLVANGDKILALDADGTLYLIKANPKEFELLDQAKVSKGETWAHLAVAGREIYTRSLDELVRWEWK